MPLVNHQDIVARVHAQQPPEHTVESVLAFVVRVIAELPRGERAGLLRKDAGENIAPFQGVMCSAGRICYPDGQLYKIATDIPTTNAPVWNDDGTVDPARYFDISPFISNGPQPLPTPQSLPTPIPFPGSPAGEYEDELAALLGTLATIIGGLEDTRNAVVELGNKIDRMQTQGIPLRLRF